MARQVSGLIAAVLLAFAANVAAQPAADRLKTPRTSFSALAPEERRILAPIEAEWNGLPGYQQQRLISSARRYPNLQPIQKERFDARIRGWAAMSPDERRKARETFQGLRKLPPARQHELRERWLQRHQQATPPAAQAGPEMPTQQILVEPRQAEPRVQPPRRERVPSGVVVPDPREPVKREAAPRRPPRQVPDNPASR